MTVRPLDLETWPRRDHFRFFLEYDQPFFNLCADVDVSGLVRLSRVPGGPAFFLATLWLSLRAVNDIEEFHYRVRGKEVVVHDVVHGGSTVLRDDGTFGFAYFDFTPDFESFSAAGAETVQHTRADGSLDPRDDRDDLVHYSVIPWVAFTSFSHARRRDPADSTPKIVFGRWRGEPGAERMPVSVEVHHALMDGIHVGRFFERFQHHLDAFAGGDPPLV